MGSRHTPLSHGCPLVVQRAHRRHDELHFIKLSCVIVEFDEFPVVFTGVYILIAVGAVMMLVGFLGCYGAIQESQCLLGTVSISLFDFLPFELTHLFISKRL